MTAPRIKLHPVVNDTAGPAYCGPTVLCAITGKPLSEILAVLAEKRARRARTYQRFPKLSELAAMEAARAAAGATVINLSDLDAALYAFDFRWQDFNYWNKSGPSFADWLEKDLVDDALTEPDALTQYRDGAALVFSIGAGEFDDPDDPEAGHMIVLANGEFLDTSTKGKPVPVTEGIAPYLNYRVDTAYIVTFPDREKEAEEEAMLMALADPELVRLLNVDV